jgi:hypothetical protein
VPSTYSTQNAQSESSPFATNSLRIAAILPPRKNGSVRLYPPLSVGGDLYEFKRHAEYQKIFHSLREMLFRHHLDPLPGSRELN